LEGQSDADGQVEVNVSIQSGYPNLSERETDTGLNSRLELFELMLADPVNRPPRELTDHAQCLALSSGLRGKLCEQLAQLPARQVQSGDHLYLMGNPARSVFLLKTGLVKTSVIFPEGQELTLKIYKPGEILGELCLCGGGRREEAIALEPSSVTEIPLASMLGQLRRNPEMALELASVLCERLADAYERVESLSWETVLERLIRTLLKLAADLGDTSASGTHIGHYIKQEELAKIVGARREVVSGLLNRLRNSGHISYSPRGFIAVNRAALQAYIDARASA
jgi:CRP/FNR family transcriptional regulator, cyclic AMP receptor protein